MRAVRPPRRKPGRRGDGSWSPSSTSRWTETAIDAAALADAHERAAHADPVGRALRAAPATGAGGPERFMRACPLHLAPVTFIHAPHAGRGLAEVATCGAGEGHTCTVFAVVDARARVVLLVADSAGGAWLPAPVRLTAWRELVARLHERGQAGVLERGAGALLAALAVEHDAGQAPGPGARHDAPSGPHSVSSGLPATPGGGGL